jgi:hypothetical protein
VAPTTDFTGFAQATVDAATRLFPDDTTVAEHVTQAWQQVGLLTGSAAAAALPAPVPEAEPSSAGEGSPTGTSAPGPRELPGLLGEQGDEVVAVRRTGGFTGTTRSAEMSLGNDPSGEELRRLLNQISVSGLAPSEPRPDRFTYTVACRSFELTVPEQDLTPELTRIVQLVLDQQDR